MPSTWAGPATCKTSHTMTPQLQLRLLALSAACRNGFQGALTQEEDSLSRSDTITLLPAQASSIATAVYPVIIYSRSHRQL